MAELTGIFLTSESPQQTAEFYEQVAGLRLGTSSLRTRACLWFPRKLSWSELTMAGHRSQPGRKRGERDDVSTLETHLGFWLRFVSNHVSGRFQQLVEENGVSVSEWVALRQLFPSSSLSPAELIASLGMTKGAISKVLDRLETKGLARRSSDPEDGRAQRIELTRAGRTLIPRLAALADQNDAHFFGHLAPEERESLQRTLMAIVRKHQLKTVPTE